jgi:hypothetical protein
MALGSTSDPSCCSKIRFNTILIAFTTILSVGDKIVKGLNSLPHPAFFLGINTHLAFQGFQELFKKASEHLKNSPQIHPVQIPLTLALIVSA